MKGKRILTILAVAVAVCVLASCATKEISSSPAAASQPASSPASSAAPQSDQATEQDSSAVPTPPDTITIKLGIWPEASQAEEIKLYEGYVAKMKESRPDVTVEPNYYKFATDTFEAMDKAGTLPTVFSAWLWGYQDEEYAASFADITDELSARGWDKDLNPELKNALSVSGRIYGLPESVYALGLMLNVDLFQQAGLVDEAGYPIYPKTMDELAATAKKIKDATGKAGICILAKDLAGSWQYTQIAWNFGAILVTPDGDGSFTANLDSKEAIDAMNFIKDLKWKYDVLTADPANEDWSTGFAQLGTGGAAMYIAANDAADQPTKINGLALNKLAMCALPQGPKGDAYSMIDGSTYSFAKNATPEEINACLDFLNIMGKSPVPSDKLMADLKKDAQYKKDNGIPIIPRFPCWVNEDLLDAENAVINEFANVDQKMYDPYINAVRGSGYKLRVQEPGSGSALYIDLFDVLHAAVTDKNADVADLMKKADSKLQLELDQQFPKK